MADVLTKAALNGDTRSPLWWLERSDPVRYGMRVQMAIQRNAAEMLDTAERVLPEAMF
jgi:hypothetical protein